MNEKIMHATSTPCGKHTTLSVGQVAKRSGIAVSAVHFYEQKGLIQSRRNAGNQRRYHRDVLRRIAVIKTAQQVGVPLAEIAHALSSLPDNKAPTIDDWGRMSKVWLDDLNHRINTLIALRDNLNNCIGCGCLSLQHCWLRNPGDALSKQGSGARLIDS
ncbi:redox-sensitive transcriptional activator SoxR [Bowmanella pacifica]|uniref:Redox-sensitive transcriptional activator SoxR n=1 Tax=Bowmanella pacifica TaxID=502051 RepID=A0A917YXZ2_9ALTE|nr:redox-sensitive transcriptional activator SoxR [Bowmanella pacifica]GGO67845.1 redox-sensitive transcriptional activator SoxR [Bowmanella pacifica]